MITVELPVSQAGFTRAAFRVSEVIVASGTVTEPLVVSGERYNQTFGILVINPTTKTIREVDLDRVEALRDPETFGWLKLTESAFSFWDNESDAIYDDL